MLKTSDFKLSLLGIIPVLSDESGQLNPEQISALSALLTFKGRSVEDLKEEIIAKGFDLDKKVFGILKRSSLRGHASIATTPCFAFTYEGSKFLDSMLTGMVFSSSLMASGRRTETDISSIVYPTGILKNKKAKEIYEKQSVANINFVNFLLEKGVEKDQATKILQYGLYGTGIIVLPVESLIGFSREYEMEKDYLPEEAGILLSQLKTNFKKLGIEKLFYSRFVSPRDIYPYPNIFKNPKNSNLARELHEKSPQEIQIVDYRFTRSITLSQKLKELNRLVLKVAKNKRAIEKDWPELLSLRRQICRDYNLSTEISVLSCPAWRVWGEKKRHRTVPMTVESIYYAIEKTGQYLKKTGLDLKKLDKMFSVPPVIWGNPEFSRRYIECVINSFASYESLIKMEIKENEAIFIIPRGIRLPVFQTYNLYNLISGYYPLRLCKTAEEQLRSLTLKEVYAIKKLLNKKGLKELAEAMIVKCQTTCFCHEEEFCPQIKTLVKDYDQEFHQKMLKSLEEKYNQELINK